MPLIPTDALRALAIVSVAVAVLTDGLIGLALMLLVVGGCMLPRALGFPGWLDALTCATFLFAAWAALLDWYVSVDGLDLAVHALATGLIGLLVWYVADRFRLLAPADGTWRPRAAAAVVTVAAGGTLATVWEIGEWIGHTYLDDRIQVGYDDTITDLVAGLLGCLAAGALAAGAASRQPSTDPTTVSVAVR